MELEAAMALKALLYNRLVTRGESPALLDDTIGDLLETSVALGISVDEKGSFRVAVRVQGSLVPGALQVSLSAFDQAEIDLRVTGPVRAALTMGASVSNRDRGVGTLGCMVRDQASGSAFILSNDHVFGLTSGAPLENPVISPGWEDGGKPGSHTIGHFVRGTTLRFDGSTNFLDVAVARLAMGNPIDIPTAKGFRYRPELGPAEPIGMRRVAKIGRTTGLTFGTVSAIDIDALKVDYRLGRARFDNQFEVTGIGGRFAAEGDSGALIIDAISGEGVGLLFAVNERGVTYANRLAPALSAMQVVLT